MITGSVTAKYEAVVRLQVHDAKGTTHGVDAVLDTGFDGALTLPTSLIALLGLRWRSRGKAILGNATVEMFDVHTATVVWDGAPKVILVHAIESAPLLGTALLIGHDLRIRMVAGGLVEIQAVP